MDVVIAGDERSQPGHFATLDVSREDSMHSLESRLRQPWHPSIIAVYSKHAMR